MNYENVRKAIKNGEKEKLRELPDGGHHDEGAINAAISYSLSIEKRKAALMRQVQRLREMQAQKGKHNLN